MMRFLKIITILIGIFSFCMLSYFIYVIFTRENRGEAPMLAYFVLALAFISAILNLLYHYKSFRFYRRKEKQNLNKKLSIILWIGPLCFSAFLLFVFGVSVSDSIRFSGYDFIYDAKKFIFVLLLLIIGIICFLEVSLLKKRIKRLKTERDTKDEINDIGNLTT